MSMSAAPRKILTSKNVDERSSSSPSVDLQRVIALSDQLSAQYLEYNGVLPLNPAPDGRLSVATWRDAVDVQVLDDIALLSRCDIDVVHAPEAELRAAIQRVYGGESTARDVIAGMSTDGSPVVRQEVPLDDLVQLANEAPVVKLVNLLLLEALEARASDVHLEGYADALSVRYRIDGVLQDAPSPPPNLTAAIVSRLKIMADLDIAERRVPQDGRIRLRLQQRQVDVRVSTLPTLRGESVVLRLLDTERGRISLAELGMASDTLAAFTSAIAKPHGIVLATGPTGSGKTTTLYAAVDAIRTGREKIVTVEDPVEYELPGVPQVAVNEKVGVTFGSALRAILRQDPDIMLIGEIRDAETAEIATQAALTGHLVLSTLHTNDACGAVTRLLDLGVPAYLVASTVEAVLAQRLVRHVCRACCERAELAPALLAMLGGSGKETRTSMRGKGCTTCRGTGYRGRAGIYEILALDDDMRAEIVHGRTTGDLRRMAAEKGMRSLRADGLRLVLEGTTTPEEVLRVTKA